MPNTSNQQLATGHCIFITNSPYAHHRLPTIRLS